MHILQLSRIRLRYLGVVGLLLIVIFAVFWFWIVGSSSFVPPPLPDYPSAQEISQTVSEKKFHVCNSDGAAYEFGVHVTHFVTTDPPDTVRRFYHTALTEPGTYTGIPDSYNGATYERFEHETRRAKFYGEATQGFGVFLRAVPGYKRTPVTFVSIREYQYEKLPRACHPHYYDDPWEP